jgi:hypothetical protein
MSRKRTRIRLSIIGQLPGYTPIFRTATPLPTPYSPLPIIEQFPGYTPIFRTTTPFPIPYSPFSITKQKTLQEAPYCVVWAVLGKKVKNWVKDASMALYRAYRGIFFKG